METKGEERVFRFPVAPAEGTPMYENALVQMVRDQLAALLDVVALTSGGRVIRVDGFKFLCDLDSDQVYPLWRVESD